MHSASHYGIFWLFWPYGCYRKEKFHRLRMIYQRSSKRVTGLNPSSWNWTLLRLWVVHLWLRINEKMQRSLKFHGIRNQHANDQLAEVALLGRIEWTILILTLCIKKYAMQRMLSILQDQPVKLNWCQTKSPKRTKAITQCWPDPREVREAIALFTVNFSLLHYNVIQRGCEAISG